MIGHLKDKIDFRNFKSHVKRNDKAQIVINNGLLDYIEALSAQVVELDHRLTKLESKKRSDES